MTQKGTKVPKMKQNNRNIGLNFAMSDLKKYKGAKIF